MLEFPREFLRSDQLSERGAIGKLGEFMRVMPRWSLAGVLFLVANFALGLSLGRIDDQSSLNRSLAAEFQSSSESERPVSRSTAGQLTTIDNKVWAVALDDRFDRSSILGREAEAEVNALSREYIDSDIDPAGNENVSVKLRLISDDEAGVAASKNSEEAHTIRAEAVDEKQSLQMVTEEQAMNIERLTSLETQLELLTTSVEEKDQELARLQKSLDSLQRQPASVISMWANPLVIGWFVIIVSLVVLILLLSNRLRQQKVAAVASGLSIEIYKDEKSQTSGPETQAATAVYSTSGRQVSVISEELSKIGFDSEISESQDLYNDEGLEKIDPEEVPMESDIMGHPLDLARAYVEMGDWTAARAQLAKVIDTGSPAEVREAEQLLERLADSL